MLAVSLSLCLCRPLFRMARSVEWETLDAIRNPSLLPAYPKYHHHFVWCFRSVLFFLILSGGERDKTQSEAFALIVAGDSCVRSRMNYTHSVGCLFLIKCDVFLYCEYPYRLRSVSISLAIHRRSIFLIVLLPLLPPLFLRSLSVCAKRTFIINKSEKEKLRTNNGYMSCLIHLMIIICTAINIIVVIY